MSYCGWPVFIIVLMFTSSCTKRIYLVRELNVHVYCAVPYISLYSTAYLKSLEHCLHYSVFSVCCDVPSDPWTHSISVNNVNCSATVPPHLIIPVKY